MYTNELLEQWRIKAEKWDQLDEKIGAIYADEDREEDLITIGEIAASALGYL